LKGTVKPSHQSLGESTRGRMERIIHQNQKNKSKIHT